MLDNFIKNSRLPITLLALLFLSACANTVTVRGDVPTPLVTKIPLSASLVYSDEFKNYTYAEVDKSRTLSTLSFGDAQIDLFNGVFEAVLTQPADGDTQRDLTIEPQILDFQYTVPRETKLNLYEVWLKYRLKIRNSSNQELADWVIKGYGKTPTSTLTSATAAFNSAAKVALRDVGAQLAIGFPRQPSIKALLGEELEESDTSNESITTSNENADNNDNDQE